MSHTLTVAKDSQNTQGSVEGISELLRCYICMSRLTDASVCPSCSKLGCYSCIKRWVTKTRQDCPHCRQPLSVRDLIKIPIFDDLGQMLDKMNNGPNDGTTSGSKESKKRCCVHKQQTLTVYCETCKKCICHECALWGEHKGHSFKPMNVLHQDMCSSELSKLGECLKQVASHMHQVERKMEGVKAGKQKVKRDIHHAMEKIYGRLEEQFQTKLQKLSDSRHQLKSHAVDITKLSHELQASMNAGSVVSLVNDNGEMRQELMQSLQKLQMEPDAVPSVGEYINEIVPSYDSAIFKIHPFRELQQKGEEIYSKPLCVYGLTWRLKVYPNGHRDDTGKYLGVFVELTEGFDRTASYQYCIEILYNCSLRYPHNNYKREYASDFAEGESWGYRKFLELVKLEEEGYLRDNTLVLRFSVRAPNYYQKCKDLMLHVHRLEDQELSLRQRLQTKEQQLAATKNEQTRATGRPHTSPNHNSSTSHLERSPPRSRTQHHLQAHEPNHQHSHSAPHEHRDRGRLEPEEMRRVYMSAASKQAMRSPSHTSQCVPSPKRSAYRHNDFRQTADQAGRRRSNEESEIRLKLSEQRRRSADPAVSRHHDQYGYRSHTLPRGLSQSYQDLPHPQESGSDSGEGTDNSSKSRHRREYDSRHRRGPGGSPSRRSRDSVRISSAPVDPLYRSNALQQAFRHEDSSSDTDGGGSQPWAPVHPSDIQISIDEEEDKNTFNSVSSASTVVAVSNPLRHHGRMCSQEPYEDDMDLSLGTLAEGIPLSSQTMFEGMEQEVAPPSLSRVHEFHLSQPSPPKNKYSKMRMSLSDLSSLTNSATNLSHSQYLSQSVAEVAHGTYRGEVYGGRFVDARPRHSQSYSHGHLNRITDTYLADGPPGLQRSVVAAMASSRREVEQRRRMNPHAQPQPAQRRPPQQQKRQPQQQQKQKHHHQQQQRQQQQNVRTSDGERGEKKEMRPHLEERSSPSESSLCYKIEGEGHSGSSDETVTPAEPVPSQPVLLGAGKSRSTSSLNLDLI